MSISLQEVQDIFKEEEIPLKSSTVFRERGQAFIETLISEAPYLTEWSLRYEAEAIGIL